MQHNFRHCVAPGCYNFIRPREQSHRHCSRNCTQISAYHYRLRDGALEQKKKYYRKNIERLRQKSLEYRQQNRDRINQRINEYHRLHKAESLEKGTRRRLAKLRMTSPLNDLTIIEWESIKEVWGNCCAYCGIHTDKLTQDHVTPLSKGGYHTLRNIVPACKSCNSSKHNKSLLEFLFWKIDKEDKAA